MKILLLLIALLVYVTYLFWQLNKGIHILQLSTYVNKSYYKWIKENLSKVLKWQHIIPLFAVVILIFLDNYYVALGVWIGSYGALVLWRDKSKEKKSLVYTTRVKRLFASSTFLVALIFIVIDYSRAVVDHGYLAVLLTILIGLSLGAYLVVLLVNTVNLPMEQRINNWYFNDAKKIIGQMPELKVIGITGSYGKTSTKHFVHTVLAEQFNVLMTPESYNTPMGLTKTIRTMLKPIDEIFIAEMGAKNRGDIKELCELVSPQMGILTSIGEQHLETFKNLETVSRTKYELIEALPTEGMAFINLDDENIANLPNLPVDPPKAKKCFYYGINASGLDYWAKDIKLTGKGTNFTVCKYDGSEASFQTKLLGRHNIYNILAATAVGSELGMDLDTIGRGVRKIKPVPHRLELNKNQANITIIDDSFNSNPVGSKMALEVLGEMEGSKKILITPGMIELGDKEYHYNKKLGLQAAQVCDYVILVGPKQTIPIQDGLTEAGYPKEQIYIAKNLQDALKKMGTVAVPHSVVLLENDLPDTYNE